MNDGGIPARSPAPSWVTSEASPWTSVGARTIEAPNAAAIDCIPRHTPRSGIARSRATSIVATDTPAERSEEHTSELQSLTNLVCRLLLEKKKTTKTRK